MSTVKVIYNREVTLFIITFINGHILCDITDKEVSECDIVHSGVVHIYYALGSNFHAALKYFQHIELSSHHIALAGGKRCGADALHYPEKRLGRYQLPDIRIHYP